MATTFSGFSPAAMTFLSGLAKHNDREWFNARKATYREKIVEPFDAFIADLASALHTRRIPLLPKPRNPAFRIYRDVRFSADKRPFNPWIATAFFRDGNPRRLGVLYVQLAPSESFVAAGFYRPEKNDLARMRRAMLAEPKKFEKAIALQAAVLDTDDTLLRLPREFAQCAGTGLERYVKLKSLVTRRSVPRSSLLRSDLVEIVADFAANARPLLDWGWKTVGV